MLLSMKRYQLSLADYRSLQFFHHDNFSSVINALLKGTPNITVRGIMITAVWQPRVRHPKHYSPLDYDHGCLRATCQTPQTSQSTGLWSRLFGSHMSGTPNITVHGIMITAVWVLHVRHPKHHSPWEYDHGCSAATCQAPQTSQSTGLWSRLFGSHMSGTPNITIHRIMITAVWQPHVRHPKHHSPPDYDHGAV